MLRVILDGVAFEVPEGTTILAALEANGRHVPHLCHDERLVPVGACRLCMVEVEGRAGPVASCTTSVSDGMSIRTTSEALERDRRTLLGLLAARYPSEPLEAAEASAFARELRAHGIEPSRSSRASAIETTHPYIRVDMDRCIQCFRCERICAEVQGQFTWRVVDRGLATRLVPDSGTTLLESSCVACGACVDSCPSGALLDSSVVAHGRPTEWTRTTCAYCGVGCEMNVGTKDGRIVEIRPALDAKVNRGHLCAKGRYAYDFVASDDRLSEPRIREGSRWRTVSWPEAIAFVADRLRAIAERHGPDAIGVLGSARGTNEEAYVAQKLARVAIGTNNVDCCARVCHAPSAAALKAMFGTGAATNSFADVELARTILVAGSNATSCHPIVGARIKQAALRGTNLVVVDTRRTELAEYATVHLAPRPGTDLAVFHAMARVVFDEGLVDEAFVRERVDGVAEYRAFLDDYAPEHVAGIAGIPVDDLRRAARLVATSKPAMSVHGLGLTEHVHGTDTVIALIDLFLVTGNVGRRGTGVNPLRGQNNVQGAAHMGCEPRSLTGSAPIDVARERFERVWRAPIPTRPGLDLTEMLDGACGGTFKALYAIGYDVLFTHSDSARTREALAKLELLVVQDLFENETARELAHVLLPAASVFEKDGTFMNGERRVQRVRRSVAPVGSSRADWEILCDLARAMGKGEGFAFASASEIWEEVRAVWPAGAGISYARLESGGLQWPCPDESHPGTESLHGDDFALGHRTTLRRVAPARSPENVSESYPFLLVTGRHLQQFNAGTMTGRTAQNVLRPHDLLEIGEGDAALLGLADGDLACVESAHGETHLPVRIREDLRPGQLFATFHDRDSRVNQLTGKGLDPITHTPEFKRTAVRVRRA